MTNSKVSQLTATTSVGDNDLLYLSQSGVDKKVAVSYLNSLSRYQRVFVVDPDGKGDFTNLGDAFNAITGTTVINRVAVLVFGTVNMPNNSAAIKDWVDIIGMGNAYIGVGGKKDTYTIGGATSMYPRMNIVNLKINAGYVKNAILTNCVGSISVASGEATYVAFNSCRGDPNGSELYGSGLSFSLVASGSIIDINYCMYGSVASPKPDVAVRIRNSFFQSVNGYGPASNVGNLDATHSTFINTTTGGNGSSAALQINSSTGSPVASIKHCVIKNNSSIAGSMGLQIKGTLPTSLVVCHSHLEGVVSMASENALSNAQIVLNTTKGTITNITPISGNGNVALT